MGAAAAYIPYIVAAAAAGAQVYNTNRTARKQDEALAEGIRRQSQTQRKADTRLSEELTSLEGSRSGDEAASTLQQYQQALQGSEQQARSGQALTGLSKEYDAATTASNAQSGDYVGRIAGFLSRMDAATQQREGEGFRIGDLGSDLRILGREAQGQDFIARMRAQGIRRSPYIDAAAAAANAYASGGMGGATGGTASGGTTIYGSGPNLYRGAGVA
jgi:hypothetical protein